MAKITHVIIGRQGHCSGKCCLTMITWYGKKIDVIITACEVGCKFGTVAFARLQDAER